jgi:hypothetical protein
MSLEANASRVSPSSRLLCSMPGSLPGMKARSRLAVCADQSAVALCGICSARYGRGQRRDFFALHH